MRKLWGRFVAALPIVGFVGTLFGCKSEGGGTRFMSESEYDAVRSHQLGMTPQTLAVLRSHGVPNGAELRLDFFFYTNSREKGAAVAEELRALGYSCDCDRSASDKHQFEVVGQTTPMAMDDQTVIAWTGRMCDIGRECDCEFDGWGTSTGP